MTPSRWNAMDKDVEIELTMDKRRAHRLPGAQVTAGNGARVRANAPAVNSNAIFYFEVAIIKKCGPNGIGVGISSKADNQYGHATPAAKSIVIPSGFIAGAGEVIGCGIDFTRDVCFYTMNGADLNVELSGIPSDPYPAICLRNPGDTIDVNFGHDAPFLFDVKTRTERIESQTSKCASKEKNTKTAEERRNLRANFPHESDVELMAVPSSWELPQDLTTALRLLEGGLGIQCLGKVGNSVGALAIKTERPVPRLGSVAAYRYEVKIRRKESEGLLAVGFTSRQREILYRSDGLCSVNSSRKFGGAFSGGDVVGCGLLFYRDEEWHPYATFTHPGEEIIANFGDSALFAHTCDFDAYPTDRTCTINMVPEPRKRKAKRRNRSTIRHLLCPNCNTS